MLNLKIIKRNGDYREPFELKRGFCDIGGNAEVFATQAEAQTHIEENNLAFKVIEDDEII